ncbi:DUF559 domain-containing protein [Falsibacillus pallidus]|uniref:Uncharacterized protein DUF559 n=1 Tax=Falsibacillus pallidus TaxID=493781 RepID=A0A370G2T3_9BACI|nr:DUF559 domain-containing protein [Falsibacillus pallidus]RDI37540.1 uncharacterized protein DUF559 [Falsibacillus pallidus]
MEPRTTLERVMGDALLRNNLFFDEQVYVKTGHSFYLYDFVVYGDLCKVVVECDGFQHELPGHQIHDSRRDLWTILNAAQSVLRFTTFEIYLEVEECINIIKNEINTLDANLIDEDGSRRRNIAEEKERVRNKKSSYFYKDRSTSGLLNKKIHIKDVGYKGKENDDLIQYSKVISNDTVSIPTIEDGYYGLPRKEKIYLETLRSLDKDMKKIAWYIIKNSNKGKAFYSGSIRELKYLCMKGIFVPQKYTEKGTFLLVLPFAPNLLTEFLKKKTKNTSD